MNNKILNELNEKEEIPNDLFSKINTLGTITGSVVFGGFNKKKSDIDIVLLYDNLLCNDIKPYTVNFLLYNDNYNIINNEFTSVYIKKNGMIFNLILIKTENNLNAWLDAHNLVVSLIKNNSEFKNLMTIKKNRVIIY